MNALEKLKSVLCSPDGEVCIHGSDGDRRIVADALADLESAPVAQKVPDGWTDPNDKTQQRFLPDIGEKVLFCHGGRTFYGKHTGGSFMSLSAPNIGQTYCTWECRWMYPPLAAAQAQEVK